ncbi:hypothetical protein TKK_0010266 [Trichogramma kaykai]
MENLQYLKLGDNDLHQIPSDALRRLHRLRHLDLRANNISVVSEDAFTGYGDSITFLNLQKNTPSGLGKCETVGGREEKEVGSGLADPLLFGRERWPYRRRADPKGPLGEANCLNPMLRQRASA